MAQLELGKICTEIRQKWSVLHIALIHRTGTPSSIRLRVIDVVGVVEIGEPSVVIAISSEHRREGLEAVSWAIEQLKVTVPIWKVPLPLRQS